MKLWRWARRVVLVLAVLSLMAEVVLRSAYHHKVRTRVYPLVYQRDPQLGYRYLPGVEGHICNPSVCKSFKINSNGFPGSAYPRNKDSGVYRIAVVGSSNETGIWLASGETYLQRMEHFFAADGVRVEVLNFSIDGQYRDVEKVILAGGEVLEYGPDLVLLSAELPFRFLGASRTNYRGFMIVYDGARPETLSAGQAYVDRLLSYRVLIRLHEVSYVLRAFAIHYARNQRNRYARAVQTFIDKRYEPPDLRLQPISVKRSVDTLLALRDRLQAFGSALLLFRYVPDETWVETLDDFRLPYVIPDVEQTPEVIHAYDGHYSEAGHQRMAERLYSVLKERGYSGGASDPPPGAGQADPSAGSMVPRSLPPEPTEARGN